MDLFFTAEGFRVDGGGSFTVRDLYELGFKPVDRNEGLSLGFVHRISSFFVSSLISSTSLELLRERVIVDYDEEAVASLAGEVPPAIGSQYVDESWIRRQLGLLEDVYREDIKSFDGSVDLYLRSLDDSLCVPLRLYFHLVENPGGKSAFAFMATYSTKGDDGLVHHYPLRYALHEYKDDGQALFNLISPISVISRKSRLIESLIEDGSIFYPVNFTLDEAYSYLNEVPLYEDKGIVCRIPPFWKHRGSGTRLDVSMAAGPARLDVSSILSFNAQLAYEGVPITRKEAEKLLLESAGLVNLKGKWVEVDKERLKALLETYSIFDKATSPSEVFSYVSGMKKSPVPVRLRGGFDKVFASLVKDCPVPVDLHATLRDYQKTGYQYLVMMRQLSLGLCLADDMGLGKTVQVLAYLLNRKSMGDKSVLLVVPSSLLGNWEGEIMRFSPSIDYHIYHGKDRELPHVFLTITTYALAGRDVDVLSSVDWDEVILDEAQNIKNSSTKQAKAVRSLGRKHAIVLTGTPVENNLMNLWSLLDFSVPGLLGDKTAFSRYAKSLDVETMPRFRSAISPFILRRLKSDKSIISDLPDKIENNIYATLSAKQLVLYNKVVSDLESSVAGQDDEGGRKIMVLAAITKLKQICNHPDQYNGTDTYSEKDSGKFGLLREIASTIHDNREKVLVFTQFTEVIPHLVDLLAEIFSQRGLVIDGSVSAAKRTALVEEFQTTDVPYMVLSLRAAGVGLNLTAASNVIHFDRWWNPAVENQATDRAYRIGQKERVMVYKFITRGTIEEKIDLLIKEKSALADSVVTSSSADILSALSSDEIIRAMKFSREVR